MVILTLMKNERFLLLNVLILHFTFVLNKKIMPENSYCLDPKPMIKFGNGENPPVLDYNLPQTTSFVANVYLPYQ